MNRNRLVCASALLLTACSWGAALALSSHINARRMELQLTATAKTLENLPPDLAFTTAMLGSFRGLAVDLLWYRATSLQDDGKFFEAVQLSDWITRLQPRFPRVWSFQAWNLAYNLSAATHDPQEKWEWVREGIRLLRDKGIPRNPREAHLYRELSYLFFHKIGRFAVGDHWFFKSRLADEWQGLLGAPPPGGAAAAIQAFQEIAAAPPDLEALLASHPQLAEPIQRLETLGFALDRAWLRQLYLVQAATRWAKIETSASVAEPLQKGLNLLAWLREPATEAHLKLLLPFVRARALRMDYHMDPGFMLELMQRYGPLDWRHPDTHAVYWAALGIRESAGTKRQDLFELLQADRMILHGLQSLALSGRIYFDPVSGYYSQTPDARLFDSYEVAIREAAQRHGRNGLTPQELQDSHRSFLEWAVREAWLYGIPSTAQAYHTRLRDEYGPKFPQRYQGTVEEFALKRLIEQAGQLQHPRSAIHTLIQRALSEGYAANNPAQAERFLARAKRLHDHFSGTPSQVPNLSGPKQLELPPFRAMVADAMAAFLTSPPGAVSILLKARVWHSAHLPPEVQQAIFYRVGNILHQEARQAGVNPKDAFPEPPGMAEYLRSLKEPEKRQVTSDK